MQPARFGEKTAMGGGGQTGQQSPSGVYCMPGSHHRAGQEVKSQGWCSGRGNREWMKALAHNVWHAGIVILARFEQCGFADKI